MKRHPMLAQAAAILGLVLASVILSIVLLYFTGLGR